ncbi:PspC domain-containing protein [Paenarthrobacter sp. NPDC089675]|uniref:PspC domain-containing protein n=1 Tax=Paenarthrobacter sp. NPDC089675 TaxID=3364376 RepID=UPI00382D83AE
MNANSMNPENSGSANTNGASAPNTSNGAAGGAPEDPSGRSWTPGGSGPAAPQQNFFDWVRNQGIRRGPDRWIGGVASGVAHRFGIDPLIVRGIFIVLALFAGVGVLLYGLAWALLPEPDGRIHVQEAGAGRWSGGMTGALVTTIIGLPSLGRGFWGWGWNGLPGLFWTLFWVGAVAYLVYYLVQRNKNHKAAQPMNRQDFSAPGFGPSAPAAGYGGVGTASTATRPAGTNTGVPVYGAGTEGKPSQPGASASSPGGSAANVGASTPSGPYSQSGPYNPSGPRPPYGPNPPQGGQPKPARPKRKGPGAATIAVTTGAALLAGGTLKALDAGNVIDLGGSANSVVFAAGAAVLGLGILVAGLRGRTSGFLGFLAIAALVVGGIFNVVPRGGDRFTFHDVSWAPASIEQARQGLNVTGGRGTVDLRKMNLTPPLTTAVTVPVDATASNVTVIIPDNIPVEVQADMTFGNLNEHGADRGGRLQDDSTFYNTGKPGANLVVKIDGTFSNVTIKEGN